jgi:hypothetical protein
VRLAAVLLAAAIPATLIAAPGRPAVAGDAAELAAPRWVAARYDRREGRVGLRWNPVPGASAYRVFARREAEPEPAVIATTTLVQAFDSSCPPGGACLYRLQAIAGDLAGPPSEEQRVEVPAAPAAAPAFSSDAPRWLGSAIHAVESDGGASRLLVALRWSGVPGAIGYRLTRREAAGGGTDLGFFEQPGAVIAAVEGATQTFTVTAVGPDFSESAPSIERVVPVLRERVEHVTVLPPEYAAYDAVRLWSRGAEGGARAAATGSGPGYFDVACDGARGRVYASATAERRIVELAAADGSVVRAIGPRVGSAELKRPLGLATDGSGNLFVVDQEPPALVVISPDGRLRRRTPLPARSKSPAPRPIDVAVLRDGRAFVTDAANNQVLVVGADGALKARWGRAGRAKTELLGIAGIAATTDGNLAVVDVLADAVKVFTPAGAFVRELVARREGEAAFGSLGGTAALPDGRTVVADLWVSDLRVAGTDARPLPFRVAALEGHRQPYRLSGPLGVAGDGRELLCVAEGVADRVTCLRLLAPPESVR